MRIHMESLIFEVTLNIALLVLVATLLSKLQVIQTTISGTQKLCGAGISGGRVRRGHYSVGLYRDRGWRLQYEYEGDCRYCIGNPGRAGGGNVCVHDRCGLRLFPVGGSGVCHGVSILHGSFRTAGRRILPVFSKRGSGNTGISSFWHVLLKFVIWLLSCVW